VRYLLELSFGPVQDFIAAARRSADLWAGSRLLSQVAQAAGQALLDAGAELIYPATERVRPANDNPVGKSNLSNVMLASVAGDAAAARQAAQRAQEAARSVLRKAAEEALRKLEELEPSRARILAQIDDALESFAAWAEWAREEDYPAAYQRLKQAFAARKNTRDFAPHKSGAAVPKNSLDGMRETVLPENPSRQLKRRLQLTDGERLDALGVIKRLRGRDAPEGFVPLSRVAVHGWVQQLAEADIAALCDRYERLVKLDYATRVSGQAFQMFPYDAALLYREPLERARREAISDGNGDALAALDALRDALRPLWRKLGQPIPYAAMMMADGDQMGKCVGSARTADDHRAITQAVAGFADRAYQILAESEGQTFYAGGEDVMGVLPLASCVQAPRRLEASFAETIHALPRHLHRPTLRAGVAIAHIREPLGVIRDAAQKAEKFAKGEAGSSRQGHALGLSLTIRAGQELKVRLPFGDDEAFDALQHWVTAYGNGEFPARLGYDTRAVVLRCRQQRLPLGVARAEFVRLLQRARESGGQRELAIHWQAALEERLRALIARQATPDEGLEALEQLGTELILARWLSARTQKDLPLSGGDL
jgi:CRISPR-associated protein Cmr2